MINQNTASQNGNLSGAAEWTEAMVNAVTSFTPPAFVNHEDTP